MQPISYPILEELLQIPTFQDLPEGELNWVLENGTKCEFKAGQYLFKKGEPANNMWIVLQGKIQLLMEQNGQVIPMSSIMAGEITGLLPYSRLKVAAGTGQITEHTIIFTIAREQFTDMIHCCPELVGRLVAIMTTRIREFTRSQEQREKLVSLGKLSAGLAHEFNNPVAAISRSTSELEKRIKHLPKQVAELGKGQLRPEQIDFALDFVQSRTQAPLLQLSSLQRSYIEDDVTNWLDDRNIEESTRIAETLVDCGIFTDHLEQLVEKISPGALPAVLAWIETTLSSQRLVQEIEQSAHRISTLVEMVKAYTHMDQATDKQPIDLHQGIRTTLQVLNHKLSKKAIRIVLDFQEQSPRIMGYVSELNQIWTSLIDNAIDAMSPGGELRISSHTEGNFFFVIVRDNGMGIVPEILPKIFDPFFTTKSVGQGTGLGLDIVNRVLINHNATIKVKSEPGKTEFCLCFPISD